MRQVRSLAASSWRDDESCFARYAAAAISLAQASLAAAYLADASKAGIPSVRLILRSILKQVRSSLRCPNELCMSDTDAHPVDILPKTNVKTVILLHAMHLTTS